MPHTLALERYLLVLLAFFTATLGGCARLPETTRVIQDDDRILILFETDLDAPERTHTSPTDIPTDHLLQLLQGFSVRPEYWSSLQAFTDETAPKKLFRERELEALAPALHDALLKVGFRERVRFEVLSPGRNPRYWRDVTGGWMKVRDHYLHLTIEYFHVEQPIRKTDAYDRTYPTPWTPGRTYTLFFEPERAYVRDPALDAYAVDLELWNRIHTP